MTLSTVRTMFTIAGVGAASALAGCSSSTTTAAYAPLAEAVKGSDRFNPHVDGAQRHRNAVVKNLPTPQSQDYAFVYRAMSDGGNAIPAFDYARMDPRFLRQEVRYYGSEAPGTIVVDAKRRHLYLVQAGNKAMRYGIAVGKEGFAWSGVSRVRRKVEWPTWTPPREMIERKPELAKFAAGMPGGPENPLGARALYLFQGKQDTLYRIHGTNNPASIGRAASSGCIRMRNEDVTHLYAKVKMGAKVIVR